MCVVEIPDDIMQQAGLKDSRDATIEVACRLYDAKKISLLAAMQMARLSRAELWDELVKRGMPWIRVDDPADIEQELRSLRELGIGK